MSMSMSMSATTFTFAASIVCATVMSSAVASADGSKMELRTAMERTRSDLASLGARYTVERVDGGVANLIPKTTVDLAWGPEGFRFESVMPNDRSTQIFDLAAGIAAVSDGETLVVSNTVADFAGVGWAMNDLEGFLGAFPLRTMSGQGPLRHNPLHALLDEAETHVLDAPSTVNGYECVVVEWRPALANFAPTIRGFYAPSLGYAQVRLDLLRVDGAVRQRWETVEFLERGAERVALPLRSEFTMLDDAGGQQAFVQLVVAKAADGTPLISTGQPVDLAIAMAPGSAVQLAAGLGGGTWTVPFETAAPRQSLALSLREIAAGPPSITPTNSPWLLAGAIGLAGGAALFVLGRVRRSSRAAGDPRPIPANG
jgi:hypothetical protein